MDFYIDLGAAVLLRVLRDRRELRKYRALFLKIAAEILKAYEADPLFVDEVEAKRTERGK